MSLLVCPPFSPTLPPSLFSFVISSSFILFLPSLAFLPSFPPSFETLVGDASRSVDHGSCRYEAIVKAGCAERGEVGL